MALDFRILGPLEVLEDGRPARLGGPRQRAVLATLLIHAGETVPASRVIDDVWDEEPPTAVANVLQGYVSSLRKVVGRDRIATRGTGYALVLGARDKTDVRRFEELVGQAEMAAPVQSAALLREALSLWRGPALADFAEEPFARPAAARLEELRLHGLEQRLAADLAAGRHEQLVGELQGLVREHPLRERLRNQLMLALYRSDRQADALNAYRDTRAVLVAELGIEPGPALQELERAILRQDPALELQPMPEPQRAILVAPSNDEDLLALLEIAEPLARRPIRDVIIAQIVSRPNLVTTREALLQRREALRARGVPARVAVFTSEEPGLDLARLAAEQDVDLILTDGGTDSAGDLLDRAPCDVAVLERSSTRRDTPTLDTLVLVPFGGADHDWAAVELGAWIAQAQQAGLRLVGVADGGDGRDASRLLASAALIVERMAGVSTSTALLEAGENALVDAAEDASLIVFGLPARWRDKGMGDVRRAVARKAAAPTLLVRKGLRPGGLAPPESRTRFTWSLAR